MTEKETSSTSADNPKVYQFDNFRLDAESRRLWQNNHLLKLTAKTFDILLFLVERHGRVVEREDLMKNVWRDSFVEDGNLTVHIGSLRKLLGDTHSEARFIATVARRGYCFVARVREISETERRQTDNLGLVTNRQSFQIKSLAVLPLQVVGEKEELEYLADGITENLINSLSKLLQLKVLASSTVFRYKNHENNISAIGSELGVSAILTGRLRLVGEELMVAVELVNAEDDGHLWGAQYHQPFTNIFEVQEQIALAITEKLLPRLSEAEKSPLRNRQTDNSEAYTAFLKGVHFCNKRTKEGLQRGLQFFEQAVEFDPEYALVYVYTATSYYYLDSYYHISRDEALPQITKALNRAFEIAPNLPEAHTLSGILKFVFEWDWTTAEREFLAAIKFNPNSIFARFWYANFLKMHRRFDQAWRQLEQGLAIDPLSLQLNAMVGNILYHEKRYEEAIVHFQNLLELSPDSLISSVMTSLCFQMLGDYETALTKMKSARVLESNLETSALLGSALARANQTDEAWQILNQIKQADVPIPFETFYLYIALGQTDEAVAFLRQSLERRDIDHVGLNVDPRADEIRFDSRVITILKRIGFSA